MYVIILFYITVSTWMYNRFQLMNNFEKFVSCYIYVHRYVQIFEGSNASATTKFGSGKNQLFLYVSSYVVEAAHIFYSRVHQIKIEKSSKAGQDKKTLSVFA